MSEPAAPVLPGTKSRWAVLLAGGLIVLAGLAAYHNCFQGAFIFDDDASIADNLTIRSLRAVGRILATPTEGVTAQGRPVLNLSLALNYAMGGVNVTGYHAVNLLIHLLAGLTLFGIVRRTLLQPKMRERFGADALPLALAVAAIWTVHPLQTEAVTYIVQRAESMMGLFYLLTLYCFIRGADSAKPGKWWVASVGCCLLGVGSKEVIVSAPLMVLLYDRTFVAGTFARAWRARRGLWLALAATWLPLAWLVVAAGGNRGGSAGFGVGVSWWAYGLTQFEAITRYLRLSVWPHPLVFEYGTFWVRDPVAVMPQALIVLGLGLGAVVALWRAPVWGFLGFWFFAILAPTSLVPGTTQMIVEHRMYLPLAAVVTVIVVGMRPLLGRFGIMVWMAAAAVLCGLTVRRNRDYRSDEMIWRDTARKRPDNAIAHNNLATAISQLPHCTPAQWREVMVQYHTAIWLEPYYAEAHDNLGLILFNIRRRLPQAINQYKEALLANPAYAEAHFNLGTALAALPNRQVEAIAEYLRALQIRPDYAEVYNNLGILLATSPQRLVKALDQYRAALQINPDYTEAHNNLGVALFKLGRLPEAMAEYLRALQLNPGYAEAHNNLGTALSGIPGRRREAIAEFQTAVRLKPDYVDARLNLGNILLGVPGRRPEAVAQYDAVLRLDPGNADAHGRLAAVLAGLPGRRPDAIAQYRASLRLNPDQPEVHNNLGVALADDPSRLPEAILEYQQALRLKPDYAEVHFNLGSALAALPGRRAEAIAEYREALRLKPDYPEAHNNLGNALSGLPGRQSEAIAEYREAIRLEPDYAAAHNNLAAVWFGLPGHLAEAISEYEASLRSQPGNAEVQFNLGMALMNTPDRRAEAGPHFAEALRLKPDFAPARQMLDQWRAGQNGGKPR